MIKACQKAVANPEFTAAVKKAKLTVQLLAGEEFFEASKTIYDTIKGLEEVLKSGFKIEGSR
ncbi:MAG: hypothetical protein JXL20_07150 [Deltaproteobacteria bacterium]|nr:hypothetical protein [Deltaproteobacteria bacterium]